MGKVKGVIWNFYNEKDSCYYCKYCNVEYKHSNATKMTTHIKKCLKCPAELKKTLDKDKRLHPFEKPQKQHRGPIQVDFIN